MTKLPTINIKGSAYTLVKDRILYFAETYPNGSIITECTESADRVTFKATVTPDVDKPTRVFTGHSQAVWGDGYINKTSATENAETSAVGRALGMMGIGVIESIASVDEINKANNTDKTQKVTVNSKQSTKSVYPDHVEDINDLVPGEPVYSQTGEAEQKLCPGCNKPYNGKFPLCYPCNEAKKKK